MWRFGLGRLSKHSPGMTYLRGQSSGFARACLGNYPRRPSLAIIHRTCLSVCRSTGSLCRFSSRIPCRGLISRNLEAKYDANGGDKEATKGQAGGKSCKKCDARMLRCGSEWACWFVMCCWCSMGGRDSRGPDAQLSTGSSRTGRGSRSAGRARASGITGRGSPGGAAFSLLIPA